MPESRIRNDSLRRCFLLAPRGVASDLITKVLVDRGVECLRPDDLLGPGLNWSDELSRHLASADFVVAVLPSPMPARDRESRGRDNVLFELGLAVGMNKPALVITEGAAKAPSDLRGMAITRVRGLAHVTEAVPEIDRFLRHAKELSSNERPATESRGTGRLDWAHARIQKFRHETGPRRTFDFERLVAEVFERAGAEVQVTDRPSPSRTDESDMVVWSDDLAYELGGPMLVECKSYRGGVGSILRNAEHTMRHLDEIVQRTDARLAMLVFDYDRPRGAPPINDTPRVLALSLEQLVDLVERGTLTDEVLARRRRAAYARGHLGADRIA